MNDDNINSSCLLNCVHGTCDVKNVADSPAGVEICVCDSGWGGKLCNMEFTVCRDGGFCYNGSKCVKKADNRYGCDCTTAYSHNAFAGHMCEHPATSYCEFGASVSYRSFCSNNGKCKDYVFEGKDGSLDHPGCNCPDGFEGDHCQYLLGEAPKTYKSNSEESSALSSTYQNVKAYRKDNVGGGAIAIIVLVSLSVFTILALLIKRSITRHPKINTAMDIAGELDPDGDVMKDAVGRGFQVGDLEMSEMSGNGAGYGGSSNGEPPILNHGPAYNPEDSSSSTSSSRKRSGGYGGVRDAMSTSLKMFKVATYRKQDGKTPFDVSMALDPDGQTLKRAMEAEGHIIESLDYPISDIESKKTIVDELNAENDSGRDNSDNSPKTPLEASVPDQTPLEASVPDDVASTTEPTTSEKSEVLETTEPSNSERESQPKTQEEETI
mmetsp:Transcript_9759/g.12087  ORF Transcript_9759/g.12087 Transcript_9759/m.12087 type:complete len:438 (+) Transcript_9759:166-1479(+)|eukprot:CAMPEP_0172512118 /NCGR_PEP_ID=MMETSP1066-20121228/241849_1 /TAXON_ID=671091 /ORGANISM="Coscinodiscus wailesii, Strain CCMP2513" /LENGTH=437 /DNA_ID=CAMNT_0013291773 /DNA_START=143 /DNA_END=1456 /DNA_ORIENTATION=-